MSLRHGFLALVASVALHGFVSGSTVVYVGDSGNEWRDGGLDWSVDGGAAVDAQTAFGRTNGTEIATDIVIGGGAIVNYNSNAASQSDFRVGSLGSLTIKEGAVWQQLPDETWGDNAWTRMNPKALNLDNGTFKRFGKPTTESSPFYTPPQLIGGLLVFGGLSGATDGETVQINITNGGKLINDGQLFFGYNANNAAGALKNLTVSMNINNGSVDLTGGYIHRVIDGGSLPFSEADLVFVDNFGESDPQRPKFSINFTGPGSITTDLGIANPNRNLDGANWFEVDDKLTWQQVWDRGILQANGKSGKDGLNFNDYFTTTGTFDGTDYKLTSKLAGPNIYDLNSDGAVDAADAGVMFGDWGGPGSTSVADFNKDGYVDASDAGEMFAAWTGDPAAPGANAATAEYNSVTGELKVSSAGAVNLFVQSAGSHITPLNPAPAVPVGLLTNNASRVGITNLGPINVSNFSFGNIGVGLAQSDLKLVYTPALGQKGLEVAAGSEAFRYIPEPASLSLLGLGVAGLLAGRRRS